MTHISESWDLIGLTWNKIEMHYDQFIVRHPLICFQKSQSVCLDYFWTEERLGSLGASVKCTVPKKSLNESPKCRRSRFPNLHMQGRWFVCNCLLQVGVIPGKAHLQDNKNSVMNNKNSVMNNKTQ